MVDRFKVGMVHTLADRAKVWTAVKVIHGAIVAAEGRDGRPVGRTSWNVRANGRRWERDTLDEIRAIVKEHGFEEFTVGWSRAFGPQQWDVQARLHQYLAYVEFDVYAGEDRMETERLARTVAAEVRRRKMNVKVADTEISSIDTVEPPAGTRLVALSAAPTTPATPTVGSRVKASLGEHLGRYIVGVLVGVTVLVLALVLGLSPKSAPDPNTPVPTQSP